MAIFGKYITQEQKRLRMQINKCVQSMINTRNLGLKAECKKKQKAYYDRYQRLDMLKSYFIGKLKESGVTYNKIRHRYSKK